MSDAVGRDDRDRRGIGMQALQCPGLEGRGRRIVERRRRDRRRPAEIEIQRRPVCRVEKGLAGTKQLVESGFDLFYPAHMLGVPVPWPSRGTFAEMSGGSVWTCRRLPPSGAPTSQGGMRQMTASPAIPKTDEARPRCSTGRRTAIIATKVQAEWQPGPVRVGGIDAAGGIWNRNQHEQHHEQSACADPRAVVSRPPCSLQSAARTAGSEEQQETAS